MSPEQNTSKYDRYFCSMYARVFLYRV